MLNTKDVTKIAKLARIEMNDKQQDVIHSELNNIFGWIEQLSEVNTDDIEPMAGVGDYILRHRADIINDGDMVDDVLKNAPDSEFNCFAVPKVITS